MKSHILQKYLRFQGEWERTNQQEQSGFVLQVAHSDRQKPLFSSIKMRSLQWRLFVSTRYPRFLRSVASLHESKDAEPRKKVHIYNFSNLTFTFTFTLLVVIFNFLSIQFISNLPNLLTGARIVSSPFLAYFLIQGHYKAAVIGNLKARRMFMCLFILNVVVCFFKLFFLGKTMMKNSHNSPINSKH